MSRLVLLAAVLLGAVTFGAWLDWGLPSVQRFETLYSGESAWSGARIAELTRAAERWETDLASNVDVDETAPTPPADAAPAGASVEDRGIWRDVTASEAGRAEILQRYHLYSHHPDEMTVFQAIRAMEPEQRNFDPRMYQYGGLFIYPVAGLLKVAAQAGWITLQPGVEYYLDHPEAMGRFYVVARVYTALWGLLGILAAYGLGTALRDRAAGAIAALLFAVMPITINLAHEAKPHLPAAVLMMWAALAAVRYTQRPGAGKFLAMSLLCGLAVGMVPSALPALAILVVAAFAWRPTFGQVFGRIVGGLMITAIAYFACNPYVAIRLAQEPQALYSNFRNTSGMYEWGNPFQGFGNTAMLVAEGTGWLIAAAGLLAGLALFHRRTAQRGWVLWAPALLVAAVMTAVGAGKPGEFGRFAVYIDVALMLCVAAEAARILRRNRAAGVLSVLLLLGATGERGYRYWQHFLRDAGLAHSRHEAAAWLGERLHDQPDAAIGIVRDPAPYTVPPIDFARRTVLRYYGQGKYDESEGPPWIVTTVDHPMLPGAIQGRYVLDQVFGSPSERNGPVLTPISWANKPVCIWRRINPDAPIRELMTTELAPRMPGSRDQPAP